MKVTKTYPFGDNGGCNGLAIDVKNQILFAACSAVGPAPARGTPGQPAPAGPPPAPDPNAKPPQTFVILSAKDGKILAEAAARRQFRRRSVQSGDDGSVQHARQRHDDHRQGEEPDEFRGGAGPEDVAIERRAHDRVRQQDGPSLRDGIGGRACRLLRRRRRPRLAAPALAAAPRSRARSRSSWSANRFSRQLLLPDHEHRK